MSPDSPDDKKGPVVIMEDGDEKGTTTILLVEHWSAGVDVEFPHIMVHHPQRESETVPDFNIVVVGSTGSSHEHPNSGVNDFILEARTSVHIPYGRALEVKAVRSIDDIGRERGDGKSGRGRSLNHRRSLLDGLSFLEGNFPGGHTIF